jgi:hypothetical protein
MGDGQLSMDDFGIDTDEMKRIAGLIKTDNDELEKQSETLMGKVDDAYLRFPGPVSSLAQLSQISINAVLKRIRTENSRIGLILGAIATAVEVEEKKLLESFKLPSN